MQAASAGVLAPSANIQYPEKFHLAQKFMQLSPPGEGGVAVAADAGTPWYPMLQHRSRHCECHILSAGAKENQLEFQLLMYALGQQASAFISLFWVLQRHWLLFDNPVVMPAHIMHPGD